MIFRRRWNNPLLLLAACVGTLLVGCAPLVRLPSKPAFTPKETTKLISHLRGHGERVWSFQGVGTVRLKEGERLSDADLFAVGRRPLKVRLEITHPWGRPLSHIVVDEEHISVLSLTDNKFLAGPSSPFNREKLLLFGLDLDSAWKILSGSVPILPHHSAVSLRPGEIALYNRKGEVVEIISFFHDPLLPRSVSLPGKRITILLSQFEEGDLGPYPSRIRVRKGGARRSLELRYKRLRLNRPVPEEIFQLKPPPGFEIIPLDYYGGWPLPDF